MTEAARNTDRELWREREGDYYADSIHVTQGGGIGINCGGTVIVMPIREWHKLALVGVERAAPPLQAREEIDPATLSDGELILCLEEMRKRDAAVLALSRTAEQEWRDTSVLQDDLRDMLRALGLPDGARPQSPHEVFRECIEVVKALVAASRRERSDARYRNA